MKQKCLWTAAGSVLLASASLQASEPNDTLSRNLKEVVVSAASLKNLKAPQMGSLSLSGDAIMRLPVMFGEPDIVKTLHVQPGVSQGVEGFTGLYVRGGENDQNLFVYEGIPLYHVSHLGGIFSSFNVSTVSGMDFYKSSFPARYGGRISSISDIAMKQPDFERFDGRFTVGLLSVNGYVTGPIVKGRTAFSAGVRRSWVDGISVPALAIMNAIQKKKGKKTIAHYAFTDFNARLDHRFNPRARMSVVGYYGHDRLKVGEREFDATNQGGENRTHFFDEDKNFFSWGNWGVSGAFDYRLDRGNLRASVYYTRYSSAYEQEREYQDNLDDASSYGHSLSRTDNSIGDLGATVGYAGDFGGVYRLNAGGGYVFHDYLPEHVVNESSGGGNPDKREDNGGLHVRAHEAYAYVDNTFDFGRWVSVNVGLRGVVYSGEGNRHFSLEPRASLRVNLAKNYSIKAGYARMTQAVQQVSSNYVNLPTDLWQPVGTHFKPLRSDQYSLGVYGNLPLSMYFSVEGWYKDMRHLLEYREGVSTLDARLSWDEKLTSGKGWAYGVDFSLTKEFGKLTGSVGYGLLWNWRKFDDLNYGLKFPAKFDNRHKLNINATYRLNERIEFNAGWTFMTGNRLTLSLYNYDMPDSQFPDAPTVGQPDYDEEYGVDYYGKRNSVRLPAYHRLDVGVSFTKKLKKGRRSVWNVGLYNAYCRMNPLTVKKEHFNRVENGDGTYSFQRTFKSFSLIPIVPSVSYTYIF